MINEILLKNVYIKNDEEAYSLEDISLGIKSGEVTGIFGQSGSGKTTLIYLICGLLKPEKGKILINGEDPSKQKGAWKTIRKNLGVSLQFPEDMFFQESVLDEFKRILGDKRYTKDEIQSLAINALKWAGLDKVNLLERHPLQLSQGEMRRLSLALVRAQNSSCVILDEPTVGLDPIAKKKMVKEIIQYYRQEDKIVIISSHDTPVILPLVDQIIILKKGKIITQGSWNNILGKEADSLISAGLSFPPFADLSIRLKMAGIPVKNIWKEFDQAKKDIVELILKAKSV